MSGYDCWSLMTISEGRVYFETIRHPLYVSFLYPMYWLNYWLMSWTGINWSMFMMSFFLVLCSSYSAVFVYRILRELLTVRRGDAYLLVAMLFSFGHVMVPAMVPDHFIISMMLLTMTAYICGKILFILGIALGRKNHLMQMLSCWLCFDFFLNMVLGFGVNEVYIMTSGWAFAIPVALAFIFKRIKQNYLFPLRACILFITIFLFTSNLQLIINHLY